MLSWLIHVRLRRILAAVIDPGPVILITSPTCSSVGIICWIVDHDARIGAIGVLQRDQVRHFSVDADAGLVVEALLQGA